METGDQPTMTWPRFESAVIGHAHYGQDCIAVYDGDRMAQVLVDLDGMTFDDARDYIAFNLDNVYQGPGAPMVVWRGPESTA